MEAITSPRGKTKRHAPSEDITAAAEGPVIIIDCHGPTVRSENIESEIYAILDVTLNKHEFDEKRINQIVQLASFAHNQEIEEEIERVKKALAENIVKQERVSKIFTEGLLAIEAYKN